MIQKIGGEKVEDKNVIKIKLSTLLLIIALIIIIIMGYFIYKLYNENQNKNISSSQEINNLNTSITNMGQFSNNQIKTALQNYFDVFGALKVSPYKMLEKIGLEVANDNNSQFNNTQVKYSDFKEKMLNYISEQQIKLKFENNDDIKSIDGMLYVRESISNGLATKVISVSQINTNKYSTEAIIVDPEQLNDKKIEDYINTNNEYIYEFTVTSYNGKCVIDTCEW